MLKQSNTVKHIHSVTNYRNNKHLIKTCKHVIRRDTRRRPEYMFSTTVPQYRRVVVAIFMYNVDCLRLVIDTLHHTIVIRVGPRPILAIIVSPKPLYLQPDSQI